MVGVFLFYLIWEKKSWKKWWTSRWLCSLAQLSCLLAEPWVLSVSELMGVSILVVTCKERDEIVWIFREWWWQLKERTLHMMEVLRSKKNNASISIKGPNSITLCWNIFSRNSSSDWSYRFSSFASWPAVALLLNFSGSTTTVLVTCFVQSNKKELKNWSVLDPFFCHHRKCDYPCALIIHLFL